ncbi:von Willebrand factor [Histoplasma ohiense]|nr:von Willebrand factor [Histoplasma ohiense (nom. inval.)]
MASFMRSLRNGLMRNGLKQDAKEKGKAIDWATYPDEPPAYTPTAETQETIADSSPYAFLSDFDTILLVDDSGSMSGSRWAETREALSAIAPICAEYDEDGFDIYFLNHKNWSNPTGAYANITTSEAVGHIFSRVTPSGRTPTGGRLHDILNPYVDEVRYRSAGGSRGVSKPPVKPINVIVITDGIPTDDVEPVLISVARRLDECNAKPWQVGIQFVQVGNDRCAARWLENLDDTLYKNNHVRDIVDTAPWSGAVLSSNTILKIMLGGVDRRYDRQTVSRMGRR